MNCEPIISIITACYNHGIYLDEAINSIKLNKYNQFFEHIIVDDGSTDSLTIDKLNKLEEKGATIIRQRNMGLGAARNTGVRFAKGKYFIPLDCDNTIVPEVILKCCEILEKNLEVAVVYTDALYFGDQQGKWKVGEVDILKLINCNYIDACALIRKEVWQKLGGYDENMPAMGHEDWDLWLNILLNNGKFSYLEEIGFYYRVVANSMSVNISNPSYPKNKEYLFRKYSDKVCACYDSLYYRSLCHKRKLVEFKTFLNDNKIRSCLKILLGRKFYN